VTSDGIALFDRLYTCAAPSASAGSSARLRGAWSVKLAYDPSNLDMVFARPVGSHAVPRLPSGGRQCAHRIVGGGNATCRAPRHLPHCVKLLSFATADESARLRVHRA
jgi:hypothetical protein